MDDVTDLLFPLARICLSSVFIYSGVEKLIFWRNGLAEVTSLKLPLPKLALSAITIVQLTAGTMVLLGIYAELGALLLFAFTAAATLLGHRFWTLHGVAFR